MTEKRLCKSSNKKFAGVCGGFAEYFDVDPTLVRLVWALVALSTGVGVVAYIVAAILMDESTETNDIYTGSAYQETETSYTTNDGEVKGFKL